MTERIITITDWDRRQRLNLGRRGSNHAVKIRFDTTQMVARYGSGTAELFHRRNFDREPYTVELVPDGDYMVWDVSATDTAVIGLGCAEIHWHSDSVTFKSCYETAVVKCYPVRKW